MKANELMIGDWVQNPLGWKAKVMSIKHTCVIKDEWEYLFKIGISKDTFQYNLSESDLSPIPLTSEILEKNGFEDVGDDIYQLEEKPCWFFVDFFRHTYGCEYDTSTYEYEDAEHRLKLYGIPSVHELQHALRLCGIEKEIEL